MQSTYLLFNKVIAAIFAAIIIYFGIYPIFGDYAVHCEVMKATGHPCIGCGLTRGIHEGILFHFDKALQWNESSLLILSFLIITVVLRFVINRILKKTDSLKTARLILAADLVFSIGLYLFLFPAFFHQPDNEVNICISQIPLPGGAGVGFSSF